MKKFLFAALAFISLQSFAADRVSPTIVQTFVSQFNGATEISWQEVNGFSVATFKLNGEKRSAYYDTDGNLVVTARQVSVAALSAEQRNSLESSFTGYSIKCLFEMQDSNGKSYYATIVSDKKEKVVKTTGKRWRSLQTRNL